MNNKKLDQQNRALSMVSHDLKSPMNAIIGFTSLLKKDMEEKEADPRWQEMAERVLAAGHQMVGMIDDILAMSKLEAGREKVNYVWVENLERELTETLITFNYEARAKDIELVFQVGSDLPSVRWDFTRLRLHVLNNIISNALRFTPHGGRITLEADPAPDGVTLTITDTGPGIPEGELEKIFHRFEQVDLKTSRVSLGAGLGLNNAKLFTARHGGVLQASNADTGGAVFTVRLPLDSESVTEDRPAETA